MPVYARAARPRVLFFAAVFLVLFVYSRYWTLPDVPYKIRRISFGRKVAVSTSLRDDAANATLGVSDFFLNPLFPLPLDQDGPPKRPISIR